MRIHSLIPVAALSAASAFSQNEINGTPAGGEYLPGTTGADIIDGGGGVNDTLLGMVLEFVASLGHG